MMPRNRPVKSDLCVVLISYLGNSQLLKYTHTRFLPYLGALCLLKLFIPSLISELYGQNLPVQFLFLNVWDVVYLLTSYLQKICCCFKKCLFCSQLLGKLQAFQGAIKCSPKPIDSHTY